MVAVIWSGCRAVRAAGRGEHRQGPVAGMAAPGPAAGDQLAGAGIREQGQAARAAQGQRPGRPEPQHAEVAPGAVHGGGQGVQRVAQRRPGGLGWRPGRVKPRLFSSPMACARSCPALARRRRSQLRAGGGRDAERGGDGPVAVPGHRQARRGADDLDAVRAARRVPGRQQDAGPAAGPAPRPPRPQPRGAPAAQPDRPFPAVSPRGQLPGPARRARQRPSRQVSGHGPGIQAQQHGRQVFPVVSVTKSSLPRHRPPGPGGTRVAACTPAARPAARIAKSAELAP